MKKVHISLLIPLLISFNLQAEADMHGPDYKSGTAQQSYQKNMDKMHANMTREMRSDNPDIAFAAGMRAHHQGAVDMAETELTYGKDKEMRRLAEEIIAQQQPEIQRLESWLHREHR